MSRRDALASDVTTLATQIAELKTGLAEEKDRRERLRVGGEIEGIEKRLKDTATTFAPFHRRALRRVGQHPTETKSQRADML